MATNEFIRKLKREKNLLLLLLMFVCKIQNFPV